MKALICVVGAVLSAVLSVLLLLDVDILGAILALIAMVLFVGNLSFLLFPDQPGLGSTIKKEK